MALIVAGMLAFALIHSLTADPRAKNWFISRFGEYAFHGWYRLLYNLLSVAMLAPMMLVIGRDTQIIYTVPEGLSPIFGVIQLIGSIGVVVSLLQIDILRFAGIRQGVAFLRGEVLPLPLEQLKTGGLYAFVRHPLYFFALLSLWFISPLTGLMFVFNIAATTYFVIGSLIEEQRMLRYFGAEYAAYRRRVGWLLPIPRWRVTQ
jgi:protein-S-isoprenylcysteine O-methyltransferase Ste14